MTLTDRIEVNPRVMLGKAVIRGTRIPVELLRRKLSEGASEVDLLEAYPQLKREDIQVAVRYAADTLSHEEVVFMEDAQNYSARIAIIGWTAAARRADGMPASTATKNDVAAATE